MEMEDSLRGRGAGGGDEVHSFRFNDDIQGPADANSHIHEGCDEIVASHGPYVADMFLRDDKCMAKRGGFFREERDTI
jgi:hypothetical protein